MLSLGISGFGGGIFMGFSGLGVAISTALLGSDVRIITGEIGGTLGLMFLIFYGLFNAWREFIVKPLK